MALNNLQPTDDFTQVETKIDAAIDYLNGSGDAWLTLIPNPPLTGTIQYKKIGGVVYVRGQLNGAGDFSSIQTLPVGFRPTALYIAPVFIFGGGGEASVINVETTGFIHGASAAPYNNISLDGIIFPAL